MLIGITGGICSGKSRVAAYWSRVFQVPCIDLDAICRHLLAIRQPGWQALQKRYGNEYFASDGQLDRKRFRAAIFADQALREEIDSILHPLASVDMRAQYSRMDEPVVLAEIPLLFEADWGHDVDRIVVVYAGRQLRRSRIVLRDQVNGDEADQAISIQWPLMRKILAADHVIDNSGAWPNTCLQIIHLGNFYSR